MPNQYTKRELLEFSAAAGVSLLFTSCSHSGKEELPLPSVAKPVANPPTPATASPSSTAAPIHEALAPPTNVRILSRDSAADHAEYERLRIGFNKRVESRPKYIAECKNEKDVAEAVKFTAASGMPVAIKSGGHSFEGFSSVDDGVVINLSALNSVTWLDSAKETVRLGPGCTLSHLYDHLLPQGRIIPGGSCGSVGIGGLSLGGGYGFFAREYGLTCDSLVEVSLVDGTGEMRSSKTDPELLWACKGGGTGGIGIVTSMTFKTHKAPAAFRSYRFKIHQLDSTRAIAMLQRWFDITAKLPTTCFSAYVLNNRTLTILVTDIVAPNPEGQDAIKSLSALVDKSTIGAPRALADALKVYYAEKTPIFFKNASAGMYKGYDDIRGCIRSVIDVVMQHPEVIYQINTLGGNIANPDFQKASCFPHRDRPYLSELQSYWVTPAQSKNRLEGYQAIQTILKSAGINSHYANYPDLGFTDWQHAYYGDNYPRLQAIKKRYDPNNLFRYAQSIGEPVSQ